MLYHSTRSKELQIPSMEVIKQGTAPDGGLFIPHTIPELSMAEFKEMINMNYHERAVRILSLFLTDYSEEDLTNCVHAAYNTDKFTSPKFAPVVKLDENLYILELWHGPTCAFKDMALQLLPHMLITALKRTGEQSDVIILVATSGDTGKAALEGFRDVPGTHVVVFYPNQGVSSIQQIQMATQEGSNVNVVAVEGNFDTAQSGVKAIFADELMGQVFEQKGYRLSSANSINWGRLVPQVVYYISSWLDLLKTGEITEDELIDVVIPTGNFGHILAAYYARDMGVPIHRLVCASNSNNVLTDFINTGVYNRNRTFYKTISPSMDILVSSNLERLLFALADGDFERVRSWMEDLRLEGCYTIDDHSLEKLRSVFWGGYADDVQTLKTIRSTYDTYGYLMDPHTAVGMHVYDQYRKQTGDDHKTILASTASPFKFADDVLKALLGPNAVINKDDTITLLDTLSCMTGIQIPPALSALKDKSIRHTAVCQQWQMKDILTDLFHINEV
ncbi:MAG: threonine synthase [Clostridiales bacterium]|jgi:threonine synthase|nr:threonine synthase [Clostridiales bacterium]